MLTIVFATSGLGFSFHDLGGGVRLIGAGKIGVRLGFVTTATLMNSSAAFWVFTAFVSVAFLPKLSLPEGCAMS